MSEKAPNSPEQRGGNPEELADIGAERRAGIEKQLERSNENDPGTDVEALEKAAKIEALEKKPARKAETQPEKAKVAPKRTRKAREKANFTQNMDQARTHMTPTAKVFSKAIHNPVVEKTSEVVGGTVARPNAILAGSVTAFLFTLSFYLIARYYGYPLSGFETIGAFALGWIVGLLFDYIRVMVTGKKA